MKLPDTLTVWDHAKKLPAGKWLFSKLICFKAPYFNSISPKIDVLRPEYAMVSISKRWRLHNHLGSVHAIAMCNMAELAGGMMTEVTIPATHRWIPQGMTVEYVKKATTDLVAVATPAAQADWSKAGEYMVDVVITDKNDEVVFRASISMWVSPKK